MKSTLIALLSVCSVSRSKSGKNTFSLVINRVSVQVIGTSMLKATYGVKFTHEPQS